MTALRRKMVRAMELRDFSPRTRDSYLSAVQGIAEFYNRPPDQLKQEEIEDYLLYLNKERGLTSSTINVKTSGLKFFYNETIEDDSVFLRLPKRRGRRILPEVLSTGETEKIINAPENLMHRLILMTTYSAGLRLSEVVSLKPDHIDSQRMLIRVEGGKGKKDRNTILSERLLMNLRNYWKLYRPKYWLFPSRDPEKHISRDTAQKIYYRAKKKVGIKKGKGIHTLRHCFATHLLEAGYDIRKIQVLLGHKHISTTTIYLHISNKAISMVKSPLDFIDGDDNETCPWEDGSDDKK
jgi:site-specific recombinase XerD